MKAISALAVVLATIGSTEGVAFACSCVRVATFDEVAAGAQIVVVGRVSTVDEVLPSTPDEAGGVTVVLPPFRGEGIALDVVAVVKGRLTSDRIVVWNPIHGECAGGTLRQAPSGAPVVIAMRPLSMHRTHNGESGRCCFSRDRKTTSSRARGMGRHFAS